MMNRPCIGVLDVQGAVTEHCDMLAHCSVTVKRLRRAEDFSGIDGIVIPGGESTALYKLLTIFEMWEPLQRLLDEGLPAFGTCAGMILLASTVHNTRADARSFGAIDMTVKRNAFGRQVDSFETDLCIEGLDGEPFRTIFIRAPWVEIVGENVDVLASISTPEGDTYPVAVRQGNSMATAFHPELGDDPRIHEYFVSLVHNTIRH